MKYGKVVAAVGAVLLACTALQAQYNDFGNLARYEADNARLREAPNPGNRVVFIGNSITDFWPVHHADFFEAHPNFIGRGISGQSTYQFIVRFREDVVSLKPAVVVINGATNDVAENTAPYCEERSLGNLLTMAEIARANGIKVIMTSVLPAASFNWRREIKDAPAKISALNSRLKAAVDSMGIPYADYYTPLVVEGGALNPAYGNDGVHPTAAGYEVMEAVILPLIEAALAKE